MQVEESSIGQFTDYQDGNGLDIYEGDITNLGRILFEEGSFKIAEGKTYMYLSSVFSMRENHCLDVIANEFEQGKYFTFADFKKNHPPQYEV